MRVVRADILALSFVLGGKHLSVFFTIKYDVKCSRLF